LYFCFSRSSVSVSCLLFSSLCSLPCLGVLVLSGVLFLLCFPCLSSFLFFDCCGFICLSVFVLRFVFVFPCLGVLVLSVVLFSVWGCCFFCVFVLACFVFCVLLFVLCWCLLVCFLLLCFLCRCGTVSSHLHAICGNFSICSHRHAVVT